MRTERKEIVVDYDKPVDVMYLRLKGRNNGDHSGRSHPKEQQRVGLRVSNSNGKVVGIIIWPFKKITLKYIARNPVDRLLISVFGGSIISKEKSKRLTTNSLPAPVFSVGSFLKTLKGVIPASRAVLVCQVDSSK